MKITILTDIQGLEDARRYGLVAEPVKALLHSDGHQNRRRERRDHGSGFGAARRCPFILDKMEATIAHPRNDLSRYAPRIITMEIPVDKIRDVIGPGGKIIREIIAKTGVSIDIEDDGRVYIASTDGEGGLQAQRLVERYVKDVEVGETYLGVVKRIMNFGAFVEILPGKEGLVHISQLEHKRVNKVEDVVDIGDEVMVKVIEIDRQGRINLSRKAACQGEGIRR